MTEVYVHGVTDESARDAIEGAGARAIVHDRLAAIVSDADEPGTRAAELIRRHWRLLEAVAQDATVLPVRFGTAMASDDAVAGEFLAPRRDDLVARLAEFDGTVQLTVKGTYDEAALLRSIVDGSPAVAKLRERVRALPGEAGHFERIRLGEIVAAEVERVRERDSAWLLKRLEPLAVAASREPAAGIDAAMNVAFLVERMRTDDFSRAVAGAADELAGRIELRYLGPLPPYSFASEQAERAGAWG